ncbi:MAG TPA: transcriptional regulator [Firmicutes bacterium]|nr:transcriptional regulator [Bacillota bacterium]
MNAIKITARSKIIPVLDPHFQPAIIENRAFLDAVKASGKSVAVIITIEREQQQVAVYHTEIFDADQAMDENNFKYIERLLKTILWIKGGWKVTFYGPLSLYHDLKAAYSPGGMRSFDAEFMSRVYEKKFEIDFVDDESKLPDAFEKAEPFGKNLNGYRIGFDAGGSDRKVAALDNGKVVFSEEVVWHPKLESDPDYHYNEIRAAVTKAAEYLPRVDAIGVSSAGVYVNNRVMVASLFLKVPPVLFEQKVKNIFLRVAAELGNIPIEVRNDGDVTALAGAMSLRDNKILGIAMGTSEAAGYIDKEGSITGCLNELAFVPVDFDASAAVDEWSGDYGCGVKYFSQDAVIRLAPVSGIDLKAELTPAEKLKVVQELMAQGDGRARKIFETIGCYLGYAVAYYAEFYEIKHVLILGRVTSGEGGKLIIDNARKILDLEFPKLAEEIIFHLPDESDRRVGQAIAAASLAVADSR